MGSGEHKQAWEVSNFSLALGEGTIAKRFGTGIWDVQGALCFNINFTVNLNPEFSQRLMSQPQLG